MDDRDTDRSKPRNKRTVAEWNSCSTQNRDIAYFLSSVTAATRCRDSVTLPNRRHIVIAIFISDLEQMMEYAKGIMQKWQRTTG